MGLLSLPEAVNAPTNRLLIAVRLISVGLCFTFPKNLIVCCISETFISFLFLCIEFCKAREIIHFLMIRLLSKSFFIMAKCVLLNPYSPLLPLGPKKKSNWEQILKLPRTPVHFSVLKTRDLFFRSHLGSVQDLTGLLVFLEGTKVN